MDTSVVQRKIELQDPEDLAYLIDNVRRAAAEHITAAFPPVEGAAAQGYDLHLRVEELVNEYIRQTFTLASPNLTINGLEIPSIDSYLPASTTSQPPATKTKSKSKSKPSAPQPPAIPDHHYTPFDARLRQRVEDLTAEEEDLLRDIARLKRKAPRDAASRWAETVSGIDAADAQALEDEMRRAMQSAAVEAEGALRGQDKGLERQGGVEEEYRAVVGTLARLKRDMPSTVAQMERARKAGDYVLEGR